MTDIAPFYVIIGPTASGKSAIAFALAERIGAEILSVDSMTIYKHMDIGTAKPSSEERHRIVHHLIDLVEPTDSFSVADFVERADTVIEDARKRHIPLVATGGTPMYYKALFEGLFDGPGADLDLRERLNTESSEALHIRLAQVDPAAALRLHVNDRRRVIRALEVHELTGKSITSMQVEWAAAVHRHPAKWFGLSWEKETINRRINARVKQMIEQGWVEETRQLLANHSPLSRTAAEATGYQDLIKHINGQVNLDDTIEQIKISTRQLARRQMKWFRRFSQVKWLDGQLPIDQLVQHILE